MLTLIRLILVASNAFILTFIGYGFTTGVFWLIAIITILYGEVRVRENLKDLEKLLHKGDYHK